jgi:hypothetical protein
LGDFGFKVLVGIGYIHGVWGCIGVEAGDAIGLNSHQGAEMKMKAALVTVYRAGEVPPEIAAFIDIDVNFAGGLVCAVAAKRARGREVFGFFLGLGKVLPVKCFDLLKCCHWLPSWMRVHDTWDPANGCVHRHPAGDDLLYACLERIPNHISSGEQLSKDLDG